jgi:2'-phosphotransferase
LLRHQRTLSKTLSWLLRHAATSEGIAFQTDGYVFIDDILRHRKFANKYKKEDIYRCVDNNEKKRFGLKIDETTGKEMIRAHQGHSLEDVCIDMREITDPNEFLAVVHGTYEKHWPAIAANVHSLIEHNAYEYD